MSGARDSVWAAAGGRRLGWPAIIEHVRPPDKTREEVRVKRKRRIEITRYSRRVTVLEGRAAADAAAMPRATDIIADAPEKDGADKMTASGAGLQETGRRRPVIRLRDLLRSRR